MARSLKELSASVRMLATDLPDRANALKQDVARRINFDLLQTTPVDTGQAVSNWQVQNGEAATEPRPAFVAGGAEPEATRQANIEPAMQLANETVSAAQRGQPIHITNVLPYIQALDEGHSSQAVNFVSRAIILGTDVVSRAKFSDEV